MHQDEVSGIFMPVDPKYFQEEDLSNLFIRQTKQVLRKKSLKVEKKLKACKLYYTQPLIRFNEERRIEVMTQKQPSKRICVCGGMYCSREFFLSPSEGFRASA